MGHGFRSSKVLPITKGYIYLDRFTTKNEYWGWTMMEYGQKKQKQ
jgi:hypothetical protein